MKIHENILLTFIYTNAVLNQINAMKIYAI